MTNAELKAAIQAAIYENTEGAITGDALQDILLKIVDHFATPVIDFANIIFPSSGAGTAAEIAELLGVSEDVVNRMADGLIEAVIFKNMTYSATAGLMAPSSGVREYAGFGRILDLGRQSPTNIYYSFFAD